MGVEHPFLCLCFAFSWQFYTKCLLLILHQSSPSHLRYTRYLHFSIFAFGLRLGKALAMFPTMSLSGGTCVLYIISDGTTFKLLYSSLSPQTHPFIVPLFFLLFIASAILLSLFFHNLNSLAYVSLIASITALAYCSLLWALSLHHPLHPNNIIINPPPHVSFPDVVNAIGLIFFAFRGHNLVLQIQGTLPSHPKRPSTNPMWTGLTIASSLIAICIYPLSIVGYWAYGNRIPANGGILTAFTTFYQNTASKYLIPTIYVLIIINYLCAFQIYAMPTLDNLERIYITKKKKACPRWMRCAIKVLFGGLTYFIAVTFPFLPSLGSLLGSVALPLTLVYPCFMWIAIKKPQRLSRMWCFNMGLGSLGLVVSVMCGIAALWSLIANGLEPNFFRP